MKKSLKVVHLSSSTEGGAGIAARRLNQALIQRGVDSRLLTLSSTTGIYEQTIHRNLRSLLLGKINSYFSGKLSSVTFFSCTSINSLKFNDLEALMKPNEGILHIHNWFNFISFQVFEELIALGYKIVVTLHDERMFTGGCHYSLDCRQFEESCSACPQLLPPLRNLPQRAHLQNLKILAGAPKGLVYIAPSRWLENEARKSSILKNARIVFIQNTLHNFYHSNELSKVKNNSLNISSKIKIGVASKDPSSYIKGGDLVRAIQDNPAINEIYEFVFMADFPENCKELFWSSIDILLVASRIDNSPNVIHEAKSLGLPVIGTSVGGIPELLDQNDDLLVEVSRLGPKFLIDNHREIRQLLFKARARVNSGNQTRVSSQRSISQHIQLYSSL